MFFSFVIPTYNRVKLLGKTVPALALLATGENVTYEVIFVDNGSTDATPEFLNETVNRYPGIFRYIRIAPTGGPSAPRNTGIRAARGEVVILIDDDFLPDNDMVLRYNEFHTRHPEQHYAALGAGYVPEELKNDPLSWFHNYSFDFPEDKPLTYQQFWTCNISVKREFMLKAGMFDESFLFYEDMLCGYKLEQNGMQLRLCRAATGQHWHQMTLEGFPARSRFIGRWQYKFLERVGRPQELLIAMHVLSTELPFRVMVKRAIGRLAFRIVDNPLVNWYLERRGAHRATVRSKLTDYYYTTIFHRNMINGYIEAARNAKAGRPLNLTRLDSQLADRGDR